MEGLFMWSGPNRRQRRSERICEAARLQLDTCVSEHGIDEISVVDERGLVVAKSGNDTADSEMLGAHAPLLFRTKDPQSRRRIFASIASEVTPRRMRRFSVREFVVHGQPLFLCVVGRNGRHKNLAIRRAVSGMTRILAG
jgi:tRNA U54 and U55 pseudouridine synthase Pus10